MLYLKMLSTALRLAWPHPLTPWRSPLLRWRMETYGVVDDKGRLLHAGQIDCKAFFRFVFSHPKELTRFLRWAALL